MKAAVLKELGSVRLEDFAEPKVLEADDAIIRVTTSAICGSDLHIVHGRDPGIRMGTIMGHEFTGIVEEAGSELTGIRKGDRVLAPFTINCGKCFYCKRELPARCTSSLGFGFINEEGRGLHGGQAEYLRVPLASSTLLKIPEKNADGKLVEDEDILFLGDIFSTAYSTAEKADIQAGDTVVVIGCGPVGLLSILAAKVFGAANIIALDPVEYRREKAKELGAIVMEPDVQKATQKIGELTSGRGADACIEAVGTPQALDLAVALVRPCAVVAIAGYHTVPNYVLPIHTAYSKNLSIKIGRCHARKYMTKLLPLALEKKLPLRSIITHTLSLSEVEHGYRIFNERTEAAIKIILKP